MDYFLQLFAVGLATGCLYAVVAIGFVLIYKATDVLNFAQGELLLVGAYIFYLFNASLKLNFLGSFFCTLIVCFVLGLIIERSTVRKMIGEPPFSIVMLTFGLSVLIRSIVRIIWGSEDRMFPAYFSYDPIHIGNIFLPIIYVKLIGITICFFIAIFFFLQFTKWGLAMRATASNSTVASLMGINIEGVYGLSWGISAIVAAVGGIFFGYINVVSPHLGVIGLSLFPAVVVGGLDSILGAVIGGFAIGVIENLSGGYLAGYLGGGLKGIVPFIILMLVLMVRPFGLFGKKEIERV